MLFQVNTKKNKLNVLDGSVRPGFKRIKSIFTKVKFVAKNVVYVKKWYEQKLNRETLCEPFSPKNNFKAQKVEFFFNPYLVKTINEPDPLMKKVKALRCRSFFGDSKKINFDTDEFDQDCDHLVVVDKSKSEDFVVGTYRLLIKPKDVKYRKFYSESEFNINNLYKGKKLSMLEAGRSCVHEKYRDGRIIKLLWRGLATYILKNKIDLIFGCASFPSSNHALFKDQLSYLHYNHMPPKHYFTFPHNHMKADFNIKGKDSINEENEFRRLPPLIKAYIRAGAWIGSGAIVDREFDTTDVLIILESKKILKKYTQLAFDLRH
tara:strand:+ start:750 stop:1709 length:960 start_codon:yes stop_codon:yes gene_type:complete